MKFKLYKLIVLSIVGVSTVTYAQSQKVASPYEEGTSVKWKDLTPDQMKSVAEYLHQEKTTLEEMLAEIKAKSYPEASQQIKATVVDVVKYSYENDPRSGLLLRYALNRSMELTYGIPSVSAEGVITFPRPGLLNQTNNQDLLMQILEDSVHLALSYYEDDREASRKGSLLNLPYARFASDELKLVLDWEESVDENNLKYRLFRYALHGFIDRLQSSDHEHQNTFADEIYEAHQLLTEFPEVAPADPQNISGLDGRVRLLRAKVKRLLEHSCVKLGTALRKPEIKTTATVEADGHVVTDFVVSVITSLKVNGKEIQFIGQLNSVTKAYVFNGKSYIFGSLHNFFPSVLLPGADAMTEITESTEIHHVYDAYVDDQGFIQLKVKGSQHLYTVNTKINVR